MNELRDAPPCRDLMKLNRGTAKVRFSEYIQSFTLWDSITGVL